MMEKFYDIVNCFVGKKILLVGDAILDNYLEGNSSRLSPEAPIPVVKIEREFYDLGGAANVAANIASLGGSPTLFSFVGKDKAAEILKKLLKEKNIEHALDDNYSTIEKTRVISNGQHLVRFDKEETLDKTFKEEIKQQILEKAEDAEIIIISDYAKGCITKDLISLLSHYKSKMIVDPKPKNKELYKDVFLIAPNEKEILEISSRSNLEEAGKIARQELNTHVLITRGEKGMTLFSDKTINLPAMAKEVYDVTGAGDSAIATLALSIAAGASLEEAAIIANHVAGIAVTKKGTYAVTLQELKDKIYSGQSKIVTLEKLKKIIEDNKRKKRTIVWTNGCFDLLHVGHVRYLKETKKFGDILVVGLNSDESTRRLKGPARPVQGEDERAEILSSMDFVDYVIIFQELDASHHIAELKPDIFVKGGDYSFEEMNATVGGSAEIKAVERYGGKIRFVKFVEGKSTTKIIQKMKANR